VDLDGTIPREIVLELIDELAPPAERGKSTREPGSFDYDFISGSMVVTPIDYENVSIQIHRTRPGFGDKAVILRWKNACDPEQKTGDLGARRRRF
jgi:hypothetical protein